MAHRGEAGAENKAVAICLVYKNRAQDQGLTRQAGNAESLNGSVRGKRQARRRSMSSRHLSNPPEASSTIAPLRISENLALEAYRQPRTIG